MIVSKFFQLVNKSGAEVEVRVLADGQELFVRRLEAKLKSSPGIVHPAQAAYPTAELKVSMSQDAKELSVEEKLYLKKRQTFTVSTAPKAAGAGFQITLNQDGIVITQDYYPVR